LRSPDRSVANGSHFSSQISLFLGTCFWNLVGAGIFGFLINPPIVLYYSQAINTTPIHAHLALFGVYGSLAIAFAKIVSRPRLHQFQILIDFMLYGSVPSRQANSS
jgi:nitric oxide reductase large subunit